MKGAVLVLNTGSSSVKFTLFDTGAGRQRRDRLCEGQITTSNGRPYLRANDGAGRILIERALPPGTGRATTLRELLDWLEQTFAGLPLLAAAHRVVHGGVRYSAPTIIDAEVLAELRRLIPLAPLHQPQAIEAIEALRHSHPSLTQIACFDTAFHHTMPAVETCFALPRTLNDTGLRRYGFHGLSYEYIASVLPSMLGADLAHGRVVVAHLGAGASLCALRAGRSIATTMSLTPLDGLPMGSRCGSLDPGAVLYLLQEKAMSAAAVAELLYHDSGLLGVSGVSADMQTLLASTDPGAADAVDLFVYRVGREIGSLAAALGGLDALVFTAGIGEHAAPVRQRVCDNLAWLGLAFDAGANLAGGPRISRPDSAISAWVIATDEDAMIMRHSRQLLGLGAHR
ncbi:acetate/propionate family kinase [Rugamonas sp.]|uniref:acetate/propionate family kinase n=1 Tax=Rugamonas sp. TaxID=1926287 RepID=UPI0025D22FFA|nr:acetate/propionate family kinase [Rugamonas sp.]